MAGKQQRSLTKGSEGKDKRFISEGEKLEFVRGRLLAVLPGGKR
jgi:hypothetical protein